MRWAETLRAQYGTTVPICASLSCYLALLTYSSPHSDVSRTSNISVSSYLRTAVAGQDDMGNDLLMARVDLTPMLEGHVTTFPLISSSFVLMILTACL